MVAIPAGGQFVYVERLVDDGAIVMGRRPVAHRIAAERTFPSDVGGLLREVADGEVDGIGAGIDGNFHIVDEAEIII